MMMDLEPTKDPKGGSPKTPLPIPVSSLGESHIYAANPHNGSGIWRAIATGLGGLLVGMSVAWFTALWSHGISRIEAEELIRLSQLEQERHLLSRTEMQDYVNKNSPWAFDKQAIISRLSSQDQNIGELRTKIDLAAEVIKKQAAKQP